VVPTKVVNQYTLTARARLADASQAWGLLTSAEQAAWNVYAESCPIKDRLGSQQVLTGHGAFVKANCSILVGSGTKVTIPPLVAAPPALLTMVTTFDIGLTTTEIAYTATPLAAGHCLYVQAAVLVRPGQRYFANRLKLVDVTAAAAASPYDYQAAVEERFGALEVGHRVVIMASVLDNVTGLRSAPYIDQGVIEETAA